MIGSELDIVIPELKIAIEYCGLYWHSERLKTNQFHRDKMIKCRDIGIRLITIFEDEWIHNETLVMNKLRHILMSSNQRIFARKCIVGLVSIENRTNFLNTNHIQGNVNSSVAFGLYHDDKLVSVMTYQRSGKNYNLNRFCSSIQVVGGFSKLLSYFKKKL